MAKAERNHNTEAQTRGVHTITMTPEYAARLLMNNPANRHISKNAVAAMARDMVAGKWRMNGDAIRVWNAQGEVHCIARVTTDMREGVCVMPKGLWRKHSRNGFTSNALIPQATADLGGQAGFNDARVQVALDDA